jgi:hypothetical protein
MLLAIPRSVTPLEAGVAKVTLQHTHKKSREEFFCKAGQPAHRGDVTIHVCMGRAGCTTDFKVVEVHFFRRFPATPIQAASPKQ